MSVLGFFVLIIELHENSVPCQILVSLIIFIYFYHLGLFFFFFFIKDWSFSNFIQKNPQIITEQEILVRKKRERQGSTRAV